MSDTKTNLDCADIRAMLSALVDDQVDSQTRHLAERHLMTCTSCRTMLDEAEALDDLMSRDSDALTGGTGLPAGFEAAVIERALLERPTVRRSIVTWAGWFAAAACLMLAVLIWSFDRNMWINTPTQVAVNNQLPEREQPAIGNSASAGRVQMANYQRRSWTYDGELPADVMLLPSGADSEDLIQPTMSKIRPADQGQSLERDADASARSTTALAQRNTNLTDEDVLTLHSVAMLMETLADADLQSFEEVDRIRRITEYDELLPRLKQTRQHLSPQDRVVVSVAESILMRIVRGPVTEQVARELWNDAADFDLVESLQSISSQLEPKPSL